MSQFMRSTCPLIALSLLAACSLGACNKNVEPAASPAALGAVLAPSAGLRDQSPSAAEAVIVREPLAPLSSYATVEVGEHRGPALDGMADVITTARSMYWVKAKRDDALLAYDFLPQYRTEKDTFKRSDLVKANLGLLDAAFKASQHSNHFALETARHNSEVRVERYDPVEKGFEVRLGFDEQKYYSLLKPNEAMLNPQPYWAIVVIGATTDPKENRTKIFYHPKSESEARSIEAKLAEASNSASTSATMPATRLGHIIATVPNASMTQAPTSVFLTDGVVVLSPTDRQPLFIIDSKELGRAVAVESAGAREILGLPEKVVSNHRYL